MLGYEMLDNILELAEEKGASKPFIWKCLTFPHICVWRSARSAALGLREHRTIAEVELFDGHELTHILLGATQIRIVRLFMAGDYQ